ncbi:transglutaminase family protein [Sphingomonas sp.]|jgi:transglutaminase-like putative cysteine protease|uniref:transglutaminase family protein n=1 Tax=Sphingomonas sp. TaxID=28214 RepID=UPI002D7E8EE8|nr:transglutaminase family protein [Sphingomonas sp.]HEU0044270.1 transglutaminase family protein [Sphingomonas sp.]
MRLSVDHRTTYRFTVPQSRVVQLLRLTPGNSHDQTVASWRVHVDCDARMREGRDGFGNHVTMLYAEGPLTTVEIAVQGEVLTSHSDGCVLGVAEPLPPALFLRPTGATPADPAICRWSREVATGTAVERLHTLNRALHARFAIERGRGDPGLDAGAAWARDSATPRDLAQIFCVAARALGAPARFVSGYHLWEIDGEHRPAPHGWAEAHVEGLGWIGFDPTTGMSPEEEYVRVAVALDAAGAAPVAGSRLGAGAEELEVDVAVSREA